MRLVAEEAAAGNHLFLQVILKTVRRFLLLFSSSSQRLIFSFVFQGSPFHPSAGRIHGIMQLTAVKTTLLVLIKAIIEFESGLHPPAIWMPISGEQVRCLKAISNPFKVFTEHLNHAFRRCISRQKQI